MVSLYKNGFSTSERRYRKTSAGAFNIPICKLSILKMRSGGIAATERIPLYDISLNAAIIMGSEDRGVNPSVLKIVDEKLNFCLEYRFLKCFSRLWCFYETKTKNLTSNGINYKSESRLWSDSLFTLL
jgi:hypothetical protein